MKVPRHQRMTAADKRGKIRRQWQRRSGVVSPEVRDMFNEAQEGKCAICGKVPSRTMHLDHDHKTLVVRGLLCYSCNTKLGWYEKYRKEVRSYLDRGRA